MSGGIGPFIHHVCYKACVLEDEFLSLCFRYFNLVASWMVRLGTVRRFTDFANRQGGDLHPKELPIPDPQRNELLALPAYFMENLLEFFSFFFVNSASMKWIPDLTCFSATNSNP